MNTKPIILTVIGALLAFIACILTANSWHNTPTIADEPRKAGVAQQSSATPPPPPASTPEPENSEVVFADRRLRIVADEIHLKSDRLRYQIDMRYPQITGSNARHIKNLNQHIRRLSTDHYQWMLNPSKADLRHYKKTFPDVLNSADLDYKIVLASDSFLSIYLNTFDYGIGAAHSVQMSYVVNYDLNSHKEVKLADLFKQNTNYLEFIARYCTEELSLAEPLKPKATTFPSWNLTSGGIRFNFDACTLTGCSEGAREVTIPSSALRPFLKRGVV
jgi:hypothetical protein